jgi:hypothetical protein
VEGASPLPNGNSSPTAPVLDKGRGGSSNGTPSGTPRGSLAAGIGATLAGLGVGVGRTRTASGGGGSGHGKGKGGALGLPDEPRDAFGSGGARAPMRNGSGGGGGGPRPPPLPSDDGTHTRMTRRCARGANPSALACPSRADDDVVDDDLTSVTVPASASAAGLLPKGSASSASKWLQPQTSGDIRPVSLRSPAGSVRVENPVNAAARAASAAAVAESDMNARADRIRAMNSVHR